MTEKAATPPTKRCFVISPIGPQDSEIREHADAVFDYIIQPALDSLGIKPVRADQMSEPGLITDQMIAAILGYDLCIADLTGHNPNVFYELAIAQAAERPVVLLKRAGDPIPFDVKDYRLIEYDLKPKSIKEDKWVLRLKEQVEKVMAPGYKAPRMLGKVLRSDVTRSYLINAKSGEFGDAPRFLEVIQQANEICYLMGVSLKVWGSRDAKRGLEMLAERGTPLKVLIMHPEHPGLRAMINGHLAAENLEAVKLQTASMANYFEGLAQRFPKFEVRTLRDGLPHFQLIVTERTALVLQYMFSRGTADSPLQQFPGGSELYDVFKGEFETLWELNDPSTPVANSM